MQAERTKETALKPLEQARRTAALCQEKLATDVTILDMRGVCDFTDFFVIATGTSDRQVKTIVDEVEKALRERGVKPVRREGETEGRWVLLDYVDVVVHVFAEEERDYYSLERLWSDAPRVDWEEPDAASSG